LGKAMLIESFKEIFALNALLKENTKQELLTHTNSINEEEILSYRRFSNYDDIQINRLKELRRLFFNLLECLMVNQVVFKEWKTLFS
jgi:hypothetical protein